MTTSIHDLEYSARKLIKSLGFTLVAVLILALGVDADTTLFGLVQGVLLKPLPFASSERLMVMRQHIMRDNGRTMTTGVSYPDYWD